MTLATILKEIPKLAEEWTLERPDRQQRTEADAADFQRLQALGVPLIAGAGRVWRHVGKLVPIGTAHLYDAPCLSTRGSVNCAVQLDAPPGVVILAHSIGARTAYRRVGETAQS